MSKISIFVKYLLPSELASQPQEWFFKVVVGLCRDVVVLEVLLAMEGDGFCLDLAFLDIDLVSAQDDWDVFADTDKIAMPVGNVLVRDAGGDVEHDDGRFPVDVVAIAKTAKLLLASGVPGVEADRPEVCCEDERMDFDAERCDVLLLELACQVALHKGRLARASVTNEHQLHSDERDDWRFAGRTLNVGMSCWAAMASNFGNWP